MNIIVQKFGGTSVANTNMLYKVCEHIIREYENGKSVVVVVSAQGKTTNKLIEEQKEIGNDVSKRETDVLISVGEQITIAKLCMCLEKLGYDAVSFTGWQIPITTDGNYGDANIISAKKDKIIKELAEDKIVVVAGFQGVSEKGDITTLGRGGSDTTAVYLAYLLDAKKCEIYTDVDGVYNKDPNKKLNGKAIKYDKLTYDEMLNMANKGAKVLHNKCVEMAKKYEVIIDVKSTFENGAIGTIVYK